MDLSTDIYAYIHAHAKSGPSRNSAKPVYICLGRVEKKKKKKGRKIKLRKKLEKNPQADGSHKNTGAGTTTVVTLIAPIVR